MKPITVEESSTEERVNSTKMGARKALMARMDRWRSCSTSSAPSSNSKRWSHWWDVWFHRVFRL
jgi:hypothetical protein